MIIELKVVCHKISYIESSVSFAKEMLRTTVLVLCFEVNHREDLFSSRFLYHCCQRQSPHTNDNKKQFYLTKHVCTKMRRAWHFQLNR